MTPSTASLPSTRRAIWPAALVLVLFLGFALRIYRADHQEIWGDEGAKLEVVNQGFAHLFAPGAEVHPRFFHFFLFFWHRLFAVNVFGLRMLPVLFGVLGLPVIYVLARELFSSRAAGVAASFALALSPWHVAYSQDLTMYTLLFVMLGLSFYALARWLRRESPGWTGWGAYVLASALSVHTHYYAVFALVAQNAFVLLRHRPLWKPWAAAQLAIAAGTLPWLFLQVRLLSGQAVHQAQDFTLRHLAELLSDGGIAFTVGSTCPSGCEWFGGFYLLLVGAALILLLARPRSRWVGGFLGIWLLLPPILAWVFDYWLQHFGERFLSMSLPPLLILLGWAFYRFGRRWIGLGFALSYAATSVISLRAWYLDPAFLKSRYGEMMALVESQAQPGDVLLLNGPEQKTLFSIYHPEGLDYRFISPDSVLTAEAAERDLPGLVSGYRRAWLVLAGAPEVYDPDHQAEAWLASNGFKVFYQSYPGNYVTLYSLSDAASEAQLTRADAQFSAGPRLIGYAVEPFSLRSGDTLYVRLEWLAAGPLSKDYTVFTHLLDGSGRLVAQSDSQPVSGTRPTSSWKLGEIVSDRYGLLLPPGAAPGEYTLAVGLYDLATLERLTLTSANDSVPPDQLILGTIHVAP